MNIRLSLACAGVLALAGAAPPGAAAEQAPAPDSGIVLAQIQGPGGGGGGGPPPDSRRGQGGGGGGGAVQRGGGGSGGGGGGPAIQRGGGGGGGGGAMIQRGGGGGGPVIQRGGGGGARIGVQDGGGRRFIDRGDVRVRDVRRGDRWRYRSRPAWRSRYYVAPAIVYGVGRGWCHRHYRGSRVLRHCHPYRYRWHRHGPWR
jgi:hypothetical protein